MKIAILQINFTVGAIEKNRELIQRSYLQLADTADIVITPELALTGYPPEDLLLRADFMDAIEREACILRETTLHKKAALLCAMPERCENTDERRRYNSAFLYSNGAMQGVYRKRALPNYGVFDEHRYFIPGTSPQHVTLNGRTYGVLICEDIWQRDAYASLKGVKIDAVLHLNASPFSKTKQQQREHVTAICAKHVNAPVYYAQLVGGQDEIVFDGGSFLTDKHGAVQASFPHFEEHCAIIDDTSQYQSGISPTSDAHIYAALKTGLQDYVRKSGFSRVLLGLSGGVDSAFAAAIAADAFGSHNVTAYYLPSPYSSDESRKDAFACAAALNINCTELSISDMMNAAGQALTPCPNVQGHSLTAENIQPRLRATLLMALSNASGAMLLTTGNKSEIAVGYCTLYGDMCGGFNPLKDIYKTELYALCRYVNTHIFPGGIPDNILTKAPTAELKPGQKDSDFLPDYSILDGILHCLIEEGLSPEATIARGYDAADVTRVSTLLIRAEYKRRQAAPGTKISPMSFGKERRYPIVQRFLQ